MNWTDWYTDTVDIYRVTAATQNNLTTHTRGLVRQGVACRVYQNSPKVINMTQTAANTNDDSMLACDNSVDIRAGDELIIHRGGLPHAIRAFAGEPHYYTEPFGAVMPGLAHQQIKLLNQERVKDGERDGSQGTGGTA
jgi:hypothetical protein